MKKHLSTLLLLSCFSLPSQAAMSFSHEFSGFTGSGFSHTPSAGQLDSDTWRATGLTGSLPFGGVQTSGDFARGVSSGAVSTGGIYAFDIGGGDIALGGQATGADLSPGTIELRLRNNDPSTIDQLQVSYDLYFYNNGDRSSRFDFGYQTGNDDLVNVAEAGLISPDQSALSPQWNRTHVEFQLTDLFLGSGETIILSWLFDDFGGSGSRDEFALDNIHVSSVPIPAALPLFMGGLTLFGFGASRKRKAKARD